MKNMHILSTDKPSNLLLCIKSYIEHEGLYGENFDKKGNFRLGFGKYVNTEFYEHKNIYITSDEKIKEDDWGLSKLNEIILFGRSYNQNFYKKIILTTDVDLIKDGVQAIPNEFLEWFVKNPSCEEVETFIDTMGCVLENCNANPCINYKVIIPKEEPKQLFTKGDKVLFTGKMLDEEVIDKVVTVFYTLGRGEVEDMSDIMDEYTHIYRVFNKDLKHIPKKETKLQCKDCNDNLTDCTCIEDTIDMKQETLEEAAELYSKRSSASVFQENHKKDFINGAKWQQKRMYSEEEVKSMLQKRLQSVGIFSSEKATEVWFKQYKKQ